MTAFPVDLHTHTCHSDGTDTPAELVAHAAAAGVQVVALTDHDSLAGLEEAQEAGRRWGVEVVAGVEVSLANQPAEGFAELHLLGLFIQPSHASLRMALKRAAEARREQKLQVARNMQKLGFDVPLDEVLALAGPGVLGRMHVAQVAWEHNAGRFRDKDQIFREYISVGGLAYAPRTYQITLVEGVRLIRTAGGLPVLAHPGAYPRVADSEAMVRRAAALGVEGLEGPYTYHKNRPHAGLAEGPLHAMIAGFSALADELGLALAGGSDYHGTRKPIALGEQGLSIEAYRRLRDVAGESERLQ